jgi:hypothetical protein
MCCRRAVTVTLWTGRRDLFDAVERIETVSDKIERTNGDALMLDLSGPERIADSVGMIFDVNFPAYGADNVRRFAEQVRSRFIPPAEAEPPHDPLSHSR